MGLVFPDIRRGSIFAVQVIIDIARPAGGPDEPAPPVTEADFRALKGRILLILPNQDFFSGQMQQDLIKLMQDPQIVYVSGGHLGTVLKAGDYVREIEKFLEGME